LKIRRPELKAETEGGEGKSRDLSFKKSGVPPDKRGVLKTNVLSNS